MREPLDPARQHTTLIILPADFVRIYTGKKSHERTPQEIWLSLAFMRATSRPTTLSVARKGCFGTLLGLLHVKLSSHIIHQSETSAGVRSRSINEDNSRGGPVARATKLACGRLTDQARNRRTAVTNQQIYASSSLSSAA